MSSAVVSDKKYEETKYRYKKEIVDTSDINIVVGSKIFIGEEFYGTIVKESEIFYYIQTRFTEEPVEFQKTSIMDKIVNKVLILKD
ncbi:hypothetical protein G9F71_008905 [Clostridium sp. FP2]|uniref:hypothetical protein n=1 Tax=Clostridium sp. FP2 TaxID=2724481 RepID=UPI0013E96B7E|nr:hypothetical protein [Clostridium sp. FP2]MBZ9622973.1 hypothetical protein [Clostridium sp. FP2]